MVFFWIILISLVTCVVHPPTWLKYHCYPNLGSSCVILILILDYPAWSLYWITLSDPNLELYCVILIVNHTAWSSSWIILRDHHLGSSCVVLILDHSAWSSSWIILRDHHLGSSCLILILDHPAWSSSWINLRDSHLGSSCVVHILEWSEPGVILGDPYSGSSCMIHLLGHPAWSSSRVIRSLSDHHRWPYCLNIIFVHPYVPSPFIIPSFLSFILHDRSHHSSHMIIDHSLLCMVIFFWYLCPELEFLNSLWGLGTE